MVKMFSAGGFDPKRDVAGIVLNRWGHAYITPDRLLRWPRRQARAE